MAGVSQDGIEVSRRPARILFDRGWEGFAGCGVLAQPVFGSVTPLVVAALIKAAGDVAAPGLYLAGVTLLSLGCLVGCWRLQARETLRLDAGLQAERLIDREVFLEQRQQPSRAM